MVLEEGPQVERGAPPPTVFVVTRLIGCKQEQKWSGLTGFVTILEKSVFRGPGLVGFPRTVGSSSQRWL